MKKPALAALGVAGACAACCAIPLALPLVGGLSVVGLTGLGTSLFFTDYGLMAAMAGLAVAGVAGALVWRRLRRKPAACAAAPLPLAQAAPACAHPTCSCSPG
jgi:hypothetical protein